MTQLYLTRKSGRPKVAPTQIIKVNIKPNQSRFQQKPYLRFFRAQSNSPDSRQRACRASRITPSGEDARGKPLRGSLYGRQVRGSPLSQGLPLFENSPLDYFQIHPMRSSSDGDFAPAGATKGRCPL